tara:strand:- start:1179 stop:2180 length:1002 start_codon:yes stop_codon:yes gene_type:complete
MDSYGIHQAQLQGNSSAGYVNRYNDKLKAHQQGALKDYQDSQKSMKSGKDMLNEKMGAMTGFDAINGMTGAYQSYKAVQKYGGVGNALMKNTSANLHQLSGGKIGTFAQGPNEAQTRNALNMTASKTKQTSGGARAVTQAQAKDRALGTGWEKEGAQSDPLKSSAQIGSDAKIGATNEGLNTEGKILKKGLTTAGVDSDVAHVIGQSAGGVIGGVELASTINTDFGSDKQFSKDNTEQKIGQGFDMAGDVLSMASTFVPELAPVSAVVGGIGALFDLEGGDKAEAKKSTASTQKFNVDSGGSMKTAVQQKQTTATSTQPTSLQKVAGATSSSY